MSTISITIGTFEATVSFRYDPAVVDLVKTLPSYARSWNSSAKHWTVDQGYVDQLAALLRADGHRVVITGGRKQSSTPPPPRTAPRENWADALLEAVGQERVEPVHRALTKVLHPDVGGDTKLMQALNAARDRWAVRR